MENFVQTYTEELGSKGGSEKNNWYVNWQRQSNENATCIKTKGLMSLFLSLHWLWFILKIGKRDKQASSNGTLVPSSIMALS